MGIIDSVATFALGAAAGAGEIALKQIQAQIDRDRQIAVDEARHKGSVELEGMRQTGEDVRTDKRIASQEGLVATQQEGETTRTGQRIAADRENVLTREGGENTRAQLRSAQDERQHQERMATLNKQIGVEQGKLKILQKTSEFDISAKQDLEKIRKDYLAEKDPEKKIELGNSYLTLSGKITERWKAITDPMTGQVTGLIDQSSGRVVQGTDGVTGPKAASGGIPQAAVAALKSDPKLAADFDRKYGKGQAALALKDGGSLDPSRFTTQAPEPIKKNPLTGERMTKAQWERKFGRGTFDPVE